MKNVKFKLFSAGVVLAMVFTLSCSSDDGGGGGSSSSVESGSSSSVGGGNTCSANFNIVVIGSQTWMAENLNCNVEGSKCYDDDPDNCEKYGRLYYWATAMNLASSCNFSTCLSLIQITHRGVCPDGWHIPSDAEWNALENVVGGSSTAGTKLKANSGWNSHNGANSNGTNDYGFSALPGGYGNSSGSFYDVGYHGNWWSATESSASNAYYRSMDYDHSDVNRYNYRIKSELFSVRCVQD